MNSFYALDNVITIKTTMARPSGTSSARGAEERPLRMGMDRRRQIHVAQGGRGRDWDTIPRADTFEDVASRRNRSRVHRRQEAVRPHRSRQVQQTTEDAAEALIGTRYVTLNNSKQDNSYIRQRSATACWRWQGCPTRDATTHGCSSTELRSAKASAAKCFRDLRQRRAGHEALHRAQFQRQHERKSLRDRAHDDFTEDRLPFIGVEDLSEFDDKADLKFACRHIKANNLAGADEMLDMEQYLKVYAMEFLLKHWDGYANNTNNTYLYNDVTAVASPGVGNIKFKMIPWGVDQILKPGEFFRLGRMGRIAQLVRNDDARRKLLMDQIRAYRETVFSREQQQTVWKPLIDQMHSLLADRRAERSAGDQTVRQQLRLARVGRLHLHRLAGTDQPGLYPQTRHQ